MHALRTCPRKRGKTKEVLFTLKASPVKGKEQLQLILDLVDFDRFVRSQDELLRDATRSYAFGTSLPTPFTVCDDSIRLKLVGLTRGTTLPPDVQHIVQEIRVAKEEFRLFLKESKERVLPLAGKFNGIKYPFEKYWESNKGWLAERFAEGAGVLDQCRNRGIDGLLDVKAVRLVVGTNLSLIYSHVLEGRGPKSGDSRDMLHALLASSAEIFVTHDREFSRILSRVPINNFQVVDLHSLLTLINP